MCDPVSATIAVATAVGYNEQNKARNDARNAAQNAANDARTAREQEAARQRQIEEERQTRIGQGRSKIDENFA